MTNHLEEVALEFAASKTRELADLALEAAGGSNEKACKDSLDAVHEIRALEPGWVRVPAMCLLASASGEIERLHRLSCGLGCRWKQRKTSSKKVISKGRGHLPMNYSNR